MIHPIRIDADHIYWLGDKKVPGYSEICADLGITKPNPFWTSDGREEGVSLHKWLAFLVRGGKAKAEPDPRIAGRVEGIRKFIRDTGFKIVGGEEPVYDAVNRAACMPDLWGHIGKTPWVIDAKRGAKMPSHRLQTAAQVLALRPNGFRAQKRAALYLRDGDYRLDEHTDSIDLLYWPEFVRAYHNKREYA